MNVALNGCGRIGRNFLRAYAQSSSPSFRIKVLNIGRGNPEDLGYILTYDSVLGTDTASRWRYDTAAQVLHTPHGPMQVIAQMNIDDRMWSNRQIDVVVDASGAYTERDKALQHCVHGGAQRVVVTAPMDEPDVLIIPGHYSARRQPDSELPRLISLGSCTTNATVPLLDLLNPWEIQTAMVTTIHAYTNSQSLLDSVPHGSDLRKSRAAACNIIPAPTGASKAVVQAMPHLHGKVHARAYRVPVPNVSIVEVVAVVGRSYTTEQLADIIQAYPAKNPYVAITQDPVVSSDMQGTTHSVIIDKALCGVYDNVVTLVGWYDNEWAYSHRIFDVLKIIS